MQIQLGPPPSLSATPDNSQYKKHL
jgi:hypothetical protein